MKQTITTLLLVGAASTSAAAQVEVKPGTSAAMIALEALDGPEKAKIFAEEVARRDGRIIPRGVLGPTLVAIRMTERGAAGAEFNMLFDEDAEGGPEHSSYQHQVATISRFVTGSYMLWFRKNQSKPREFLMDWDAFLETFGDYYNNGFMWRTLFSKTKSKRVGPYRRFKSRHKWTESVRSHYAGFAADAEQNRFRQFARGLEDGPQTLMREGKKFGEGMIAGGELVGPWTFFHKNGKQALKCVMVASVIEGDAKYWHPNGNRKQDATYRAGVLHGRLVSYYQNGMTSSEGELVDGKRDGEWKTYEYGGLTPTVTRYEAGKLVPASPAK